MINYIISVVCWYSNTNSALSKLPLKVGDKKGNIYITPFDEVIIQLFHILHDNLVDLH